MAAGIAAVTAIPTNAALPDAAFLMVPVKSPAHRPADLAGQVICFMIGSDAQEALDATFDRLHIEFAHLAFQETPEMEDAYNVGRCQAVAADMATLAELRAAPGVNDPKSRVLAPLDSPLPLAGGG